MNSSGNRTVIKPGVQTAQDGVFRHSLPPVSELNNNRVQDKEDSLNPTGESTPTRGSQLNGHTVLPRRSTEAEDDLNQGLPETKSSVKACPLRNIQQQAKRTYQGIRKWVVMLFLYLAGPVPTRQSWNSTSDSIMGLLAVVVGLGNLWRFPYYCYKHKGVYFIIAYGVTLLTIGFPLMVVDISVGQYLSLGPTNAYASMAPLFSGLGWAMVASSALISIYYAVVLGWTITYLQHSIRKDFTFTPNWTASRPGLIEDNYQKATEFFRNEVVYLKGDKDFEIQPQLVLSLSLTWLLVTVILVRGIRSSSKVMYFTNLIPIAVLLFLLAYSFVTYDWDVWNKSFNLYFSPTQVTVAIPVL
ncbi:sodium- and chloride-dependent taurine transporter-like isoform X2 [Macrobrachium nipponense]